MLFNKNFSFYDNYFASLRYLVSSAEKKINITFQVFTIKVKNVHTYVVILINSYFF